MYVYIYIYIYCTYHVCLRTCYIICGSLFNSRHPDPWRAWKAGCEPRLLTPLPRMQRMRRRIPNRANSCVFALLSATLPPRRPKVTPHTHKSSQRHPKVAQSGTPHPPRAPKGTPRRPKVIPQTFPKSSKRHPKSSKGTPKRPTEGTLGTQYIDKLPINRPKRPLCYNTT